MNFTDFQRYVSGLPVVNRIDLTNRELGALLKVRRDLLDKKTYVVMINPSVCIGARMAQVMGYGVLDRHTYVGMYKDEGVFMGLFWPAELGFWDGWMPQRKAAITAIDRFLAGDDTPWVPKPSPARINAATHVRKAEAALDDAYYPPVF